MLSDNNDTGEIDIEGLGIFMKALIGNQIKALQNRICKKKYERCAGRMGNQEEVKIL